jgi:hypothetical protein
MEYSPIFLKLRNNFIISKSFVIEPITKIFKNMTDDDWIIHYLLLIESSCWNSFIKDDRIKKIGKIHSILFLTIVLFFTLDF